MKGTNEVVLLIKGGVVKIFKARLVLLLFLFAAVLSSCVPANMKIQTMLAPAEDKALVRFISPKAIGYIFDSEKVIGFAYPGTQFDYLAEPGAHLFIASMENKVVMEAELEAGKTYYVIMRRFFGVWRQRIAFLPVKRGDKYWDSMSVYEAKYRRYELKDEVREKWQRKFEPRMPAIIDNYWSVQKEKYAWPMLDIEDGR
jgi:hypothetical protein